MFTVQYSSSACVQFAQVWLVHFIRPLYQFHHLTVCVRLHQQLRGSTASASLTYICNCCKVIPCSYWYAIVNKDRIGKIVASFEPFRVGSDKLCALHLSNIKERNMDHTFNLQHKNSINFSYQNRKKNIFCTCTLNAIRNEALKCKPSALTVSVALQIVK